MPPLNDTFPELGPVFGPVAAELWRLFGPVALFIVQWAFLCGFHAPAGVPPFGPINIDLSGITALFRSLFFNALACCGIFAVAVWASAGSLLALVVRRRRRRP